MLIRLFSLAVKIKPQGEKEVMKTATVLKKIFSLDATSLHFFTMATILFYF